MKTIKWLSFVFVLTFLFSSSSWCDSVKKTVREIIENEYIWDKAIYLETEGFIIQYEKTLSDTSTSYYLLKGYYGDTLRVNTAGEKPEINQKYRVWGILYKFHRRVNDKEIYIPLLSDLFSPTKKEITFPLLSEKGKECISCRPPQLVDSDGDMVPDNIDKCPNTPRGDQVDENGCTIEKIPIIPLIAGGVGLILIGLFVFIRTRNKSNQLDFSETLTGDYSKIPKTEAPVYQPTHSDTDFKTIKINTLPSKTMRLIPGRLEIINGEDKGKTFLIQGYPTKDGSIVTIGRETVTGDRSHCHIQIDSRFQTVSRKQAEIIYKDKKLFVRNLSETNITETDGKELGLGEIVEINPGSIIKMGEIEFQYKL